MAKATKAPRRVPPHAIKTGSLNELQLATKAQLIAELKTRVGAMVIGYTKIPRLKIDHQEHSVRQLDGSTHIDHAAICVVGGPSCLLESLAELVDATVEKGISGDECSP